MNNTTEELRRFCIEKAVDNAKGRTLPMENLIKDAQAMEAYITGVTPPSPQTLAERIQAATVTATIGGAGGSDIVGGKG